MSLQQCWEPRHLNTPCCCRKGQLIKGYCARSHLHYGAKDKLTIFNLWPRFRPKVAVLTLTDQMATAGLAPRAEDIALLGSSSARLIKAIDQMKLLNLFFVIYKLSPSYKHCLEINDVSALFYPHIPSFWFNFLGFRLLLFCAFIKILSQVSWKKQIHKKSYSMTSQRSSKVLLKALFIPF